MEYLFLRKLDNMYFLVNYLLRKYILCVELYHFDIHHKHDIIILKV